MSARYRCRFVAPTSSDWADVEADSPESAANEFHFKRTELGRQPDSVTYIPDADKPGSRIHFARVAVDGHGEMVSRVYTIGIIRRGVAPRRMSLAEVARIVRWEHDPAELLGDKESP